MPISVQVQHANLDLKCIFLLDYTLADINSTRFIGLRFTVHRCVRCMKIICLLFQYTLEMCHFYEQNGLLGCIARQVLCPPMVTRTYNKSSPGEYTPLVETVLPPRLSLRSFAGHQNIVYMLVGMGLAWVFGFGPTTFFFVLLFLWLFYVLLKACLQSWFGSSHRSATVEAFPSPSPMNQSDVFPGL